MANSKAGTRFVFCQSRLIDLFLNIPTFNGIQFEKRVNGRKY
jgi:hypothetical protein